MDLEKLQELIRLFEASSLSELEIEEEGRRMRLQKGAPYAPAHAPAVLPYAPQPPNTVLTPATPPEPPEEVLPTIDSPMVGTFYSCPAPGEAPFVKPGDRVSEGQTVCIVEAMKLMNEVGAKFGCVIEKALVENGEPVEFGQPLYAIRPL